MVISKIMRVHNIFGSRLLAPYDGQTVEVLQRGSGGRYWIACKGGLHVEVTEAELRPTEGWDKPKEAGPEFLREMNFLHEDTVRNIGEAAATTGHHITLTLVGLSIRCGAPDRVYRLSEMNSRELQRMWRVDSYGKTLDTPWVMCGTIRLMALW